MKRLLANERGTAIVTAIALMTAMAAAGLAAFSVVDTQQTEAMRDRQREGSFNYSEATLNNQAFLLSRRWPGAPSSQYPTCTQANAAANPTSCPQPAQLGVSYQGPDYQNAEWTTSVRDDTGSAFYKQDDVEARPAWDENSNNSVWVRSQAEVRGRIRTLVALVRIQETPESLPRRTVISGRFTTGNNGQKVIVETNSTATSPHPVTVRCDPNDSACMRYRNGQINPPGATAGPDYVNPDGTPKPAVEPEVVERLRDRAIADGTYYTSCPATPAGRVVYITNGNCQWQSNGSWNSFEEPGIVIMERGTLSFRGTADFYGILYHLNLDNEGPKALVELGGANTLHGAIFVDGLNGLVNVGSDKVNLIYDDRIFQGVSSYGTASIVQNSWREITAD